MIQYTLVCLFLFASLHNCAVITLPFKSSIRLYASPKLSAYPNKAQLLNKLNRVEKLLSECNNTLESAISINSSKVYINPCQCKGK